MPDISEYAALFSACDDLTQVAGFTNVQSCFYWSGTEFVAGASARLFFPVSGLQGYSFQNNQFFAVAVRPGDVAASVSEPQTLALTPLALGATVAARGRRSS